MHTDTMRKASLKDLLKERREQITPESVGLRHNPNGRSPGLTIEETAVLAGVSVRGYAMLENGEYHAPGHELLDRVADALLMDDLARTDLYFLATGHPPPAPRRPPTTALPGHRALVRASHPHIALLTDHASNVMAYNEPAAALFAPADNRALTGLNTALWLFDDTAAAVLDRVHDLQRIAVARLKLATIRYPADRVLHDVVAELRTRPAGERLWASERARTDETVARISVRNGDGAVVEILWTCLELDDGLLLHTGMRERGEHSTRNAPGSGRSASQ